MPSAPAVEEVEEAMLWGSGGGCSFQEFRSPLPASCLRPPNVGLVGEKFGCGSGTPGAAPRRPPARPARRLLPLPGPQRPPGARPGRCAGGGPGSGRGAAAREPSRAAQSAGARGSDRRRGGGAGLRGGRPYLGRRGAEVAPGAEGGQVQFPAVC